MSHEFKGYVWLQRNSNNHDYIIVWWIKSILLWLIRTSREGVFTETSPAEVYFQPRFDIHEDTAPTTQEIMTKERKLSLILALNLTILQIFNSTLWPQPFHAFSSIAELFLTYQWIAQK